MDHQSFYLIIMFNGMYIIIYTCRFNFQWIRSLDWIKNNAMMMSIIETKRWYNESEFDNGKSMKSIMMNILL